MKIKLEKDGLIGVRTQWDKENESIDLFSFDQIAMELNINCRNCKYSNSSNKTLFHETELDCKKLSRWVKRDFYCWYFKRREQ